MSEPYKFKVGDVCPRRDPSKAPVTIVCINAPGDQPIVAVWVCKQGCTQVGSYTCGGYFRVGKSDSDFDILPPVPAKVEERKAREIWISEYDASVFLHFSKEDAEIIKIHNSSTKISHFHEVLPDQPEPTGRRYSSVRDMVEGEGVSEEVKLTLTKLEESDQPQEPKKEGLTFEEWRRSFEVCQASVGSLVALERSLLQLASFLLPHEQEKGKE